MHSKLSQASICGVFTSAGHKKKRKEGLSEGRESTFKSSIMSNKNKIPERWEKYTNMGRIIPGTRFITFKVPLRQEIMLKVKNSSWFCPRTVMDHCHNLGVVIDLTDTFRYYNPEEFENRGVSHLKIRIRGRILPDEKAVQKFMQAVNKFLEKNKENDKVIGVHCTHGLNRSGYMVCRYMIQVLGIPPDQAIADFNSARGHEQERENYLSDLRQAPWMNEPVPRYIKSASTKDNSLLDTSTTSLDTTNNTSNSEAESPGASLIIPRGRSWKIPLLRQSGAEEDESGSLPPYRRWSRSPRDEQEDKRASRRTRRHHRTEGSSPEEPPSTRHQVRYSPYGARSYYDQIYQGRVAPQYDHHFYQHQGSGVGPHRAVPRHHRQPQAPNNAPRQYRGPRPYRSPPAADTTTTPARREGARRDDETFKTPDANTPRLRSHQGPIRNALSPGVRDDVFSSGTPRRSARMTPY